MPQTTPGAHQRCLVFIGSSKAPIRAQGLWQPASTHHHPPSSLRHAKPSHHALTPASPTMQCVQRRASKPAACSGTCAACWSRPLKQALDKGMLLQQQLGTEPPPPPLHQPHRLPCSAATTARPPYSHGVRWLPPIGRMQVNSECKHSMAWACNSLRPRWVAS